MFPTEMIMPLFQAQCRRYRKNGAVLFVGCIE
jgi:hypothetical protein